MNWPASVGLENHKGGSGGTGNRSAGSTGGSGRSGASVGTGGRRGGPGLNRGRRKGPGNLGRAGGPGNDNGRRGGPGGTSAGIGGAANNNQKGAGRQERRQPSQMPIKSVKDLAKFLGGEAKASGFSKAGLGQALRQVPGLVAQGAKGALKTQARIVGARLVRGTVGRLLGNYPRASYAKGDAAKRSALKASLKKAIVGNRRRR